METTPRIGFGKMALLGVGWFGIQFFWGLHAGSMPLFLKGFTDSKFKISLVLSLAGLAGCIVPPIVGNLSDRSRIRFGRRRPFIFIGSIGAVLCIFSLPHLTTFGLVAVLSAIMYFSVRFSETPFLSLLPDITPPEQRSTASGIMNLFGAIGLICIFYLSSKIWEQHSGMVFRLVAIVCFGAVFFAIFFLTEPKLSFAGPVEGQRSFIVYLRSIAKEGSAMRFYVAQFFWWLGFWMVTTFATLFAVEELGVPEGKSFFILMVSSLVAMVFMVPLGILGDRFGRKSILSCMVVLWVVSEILIGLSQNFAQALIAVGIGSIPFAGVMAVGYAYLLDLIPQDRTAEFVGFSIISVASSQIVGPLVGGKLIDTFGYRSIFPAAALFMAIGVIVLQFIQPRQAIQVIPSNAEGKISA